MSRLGFLALMLAALGAMAQPAAPVSGDADTEPAPAPAEVETQAPAVNLNYSEQEQTAAARVVEEAVSAKIRQVNEVMQESEAWPVGPAAAVETPAQESEAAALPRAGAVEPPAPEWSPLKNSLQALFGLLVVLGLLFALAYLIKRYGKNSPMFAGVELGRVLGKVYLSPRASLHFVRTGGKILVVGITPNAISPVAEFDAGTFEAAGAERAATAEGAAQSETESFLAQFKASLDNIARTTQSEPSGDEDGEISALREDVQRLQRYLQESVRGGDNP